MRSKSLALALLLLTLPLALCAKYVPRDRWPFVNRDFVPGEVLMQNGDRIILEKANVGVEDGKLYYIENDTLKVSNAFVRAARIGSDDFIHVDNRLMKILRKTEHGAVLFDATVDREVLSRKDVGYGFKSSVSSTETRDIWESGSGAVMSLRMVQRPLSELQMAVDQGEPLPLRETKYVYVNGKPAVRAVKPDVRAIPGLDKKRLDAFWKQNKVKYSDDDSLAALVEFLWAESEAEMN